MVEVRKEVVGSVGGGMVARKVICLDLDTGNLCIHTCNNSPSCTLNICSF